MILIYMTNSKFVRFILMHFQKNESLNCVRQSRTLKNTKFISFQLVLTTNKRCKLLLYSQLVYFQVEQSFQKSI